MKLDPRTRSPAAGVSAEPVGMAGSSADRRREVRDGLIYCVKVFASVRILLALLALVGVALLPDLSTLPEETRASRGIPGPVDVPGWPAPERKAGLDNAVIAWERFDALWYLRIADRGYEDAPASAAFFPMYPMITRVLSFALGGHPLGAALLVSNLAFLGALMLLYLLGRMDLGEEVARKGVLYAAVFPSALFFFAPYSESLFLLVTVGAFLAARRGRWALAGAAGVLAGLTRNVGILLVIPLAVEALHQAVEGNTRKLPLRKLAWSAGPALGTFLYLLYWRVQSGDWLAPVSQQANWQRELSNPLQTLVGGTQEAWRWVGQYSGGYHMLDWLIALPVLAAVVYAAFRLRPSYGAFAVVTVAIPLTFIFAGRPLMSFPRFALVVFPIYWAFARWTNVRWRHDLLVACSATLLGIMTLLFVNWYYVF